jgi:hypothetical protein
MALVIYCRDNAPRVRPALPSRPELTWPASVDHYACCGRREAWRAR